jgi:N-acetyl-anhydromuramyl-L-alanine amidase AmpD
MDNPTAKRFFEQLETFSYRCRIALGLDGPQSPWGEPALAGSAPKGAILHFTADGRTDNVVKWFTEPKEQAKASAHVVVSDVKCPWAAGLDSDLDLIQQVPVTIVQCRKPSEIAWHATWTNSTCYGIENVNWGELRKNGDQFCWWAPKDRASPAWTAPYEGPRDPVALFGRYWHPYTTEQLMANVTILRALNGLFATQLTQSWIVGHENVQGVATPGSGNHDKRDVGPAFPIHELRDAVITGNVDALMAANAQPEWGALWRSKIAYDALLAMGIQGPYDGSGWVEFMVQCSKPGPPSKILVKSMLKCLGYSTGAATMPVIDPDDSASIYLFQRMAGLAQTNTVDSPLRDALVSRLVDRFSNVPTPSQLRA